MREEEEEEGRGHWGGSGTFLVYSPKSTSAFTRYHQFFVTPGNNLTHSHT